jgi:hypothetical protein
MGVSDDISSQVKIFIDGPMGSFQLVRVESINVTDAAGVDVITVVGVDEGAGLRYKPGGGEISMTVYREQGKPEVDYRYAKKLKWRFAITLQDVGGQREQYWCAVASADRKDDDKGSHMDDIKLVFTRRRQLPAV